MNKVKVMKPITLSKENRNRVLGLCTECGNEVFVADIIRKEKQELYECSDCGQKHKVENLR